MGLNLEKSFKYMFQDTEWKKKFLIGGFFSIGMVLMQLGRLVNQLPDSFYDEKFKNMPMEGAIAILILLLFVFLVSSVLSCFTSGYFAKNINLRIFRPNAPLLPWDNFGNMFVVGVKASFAVFIYFLILIALMTIPFLFSVLIAVSGGDKALILLLMIISILFAIILLFVFCFYLAAASLAFSTDLKFSSYFNFKLIHQFIKKDFFNFFIYIIILFALNSLMGILNTILTLTIVGLVLLPFTTYYQCLVANDIAAQFVRDNLGLDKVQQA